MSLLKLAQSSKQEEWKGQQRQIATRNACVSGSCCRRQKAREDEGSEKEVLETAAAEWQRAIAAIGRGPVAATVYLPLTAGDDDDRHLPGH